MRATHSPILLLIALLWLSSIGFALPDDALPTDAFPAHPDAIPKVRPWNPRYTTLDDYTRAATSGESEAQYYLGYVYLNGEGVKKDLPRAVGWLKKAADAGEPRAEYALGLLHMTGGGVPKDLDAARKWMGLAATWNLPEARAALAELDRLQQTQTSSDLHARAQRGEAAAQYQLAKQLMASKTPAASDLAQARDWLERAAAHRHPESAYELAVAYRDGIGGARDLEQAKSWFERATEVGVLRARIALAELARTDGSARAPQSVAMAAAAPLPAARRGDANAQFELGKMYLSGDVVTRDPKAAYQWLVKAANQNHRPAQRLLADTLARGIDFEQNYDEAAKWYLRAAQAGDAEAQFVMGNLYGVGLGVKANAAESTRWYAAAAKQGNSKAQQRLTSAP